MMKPLLYIALFVLSFHSMLFAQNFQAIGTWQSHLSYRDARHICFAENKVYVSSSSGLFFLNMEDGSVEKLTISDGLSSLKISAMNYDPPTKSLVLGYENGLIDLIQGKSISSINEIAEFRQIITSKAYHDVAFMRGTAYLAAGFGLVELDLNSRNITRVIRNLGIAGAQIKVNDVEVFTDSLFLATDLGLMVGNARDNLQSFTAWKRFDHQISDTVKYIAAYSGQLYALTSSRLYAYAHGLWSQKISLSGKNNKHLSASDRGLLLIHTDSIFSVNSDFILKHIASDLYSSPAESYQRNGIIWIADKWNGLVTNHSGTFESIYPNGPFSSSIYKMKALKDQLIAFPPAYTENYLNLNSTLGFYLYKNGIWTNYSSVNSDKVKKIPPEWLSFTGAAEKNDQLYLATANGKIIKLNKSMPQASEVLSASSLGSTLSDQDNKLTDLATDASGNIWITSYSQASSPSFNPLHVLNNEGEWLTGFFNTRSARFYKIVSHPNGALWLPSLSGGLHVLDPISKESLFLTRNNSRLASDFAHDIELDTEGAMWVGTENGVTVFSSTASFPQNPNQGFLPVFQETSFLFRNQRVNCLAIDPGNRKWIGTNSGLYLINSTGANEYAHFTKKNSPLSSDQILDIEIVPHRGEVFIATVDGLMSFRADFSASQNQHENVHVFPNPVHKSFSGAIGISGLVTNAHVIITDIVGNKVYETRSFGGTASWNLMDYNGQRAVHGIYLVMSTNENGEETYMTKFVLTE